MPSLHLPQAGLAVIFTPAWEKSGPGAGGSTLLRAGVVVTVIAFNYKRNCCPLYHIGIIPLQAVQQSKQ